MIKKTLLCVVIIFNFTLQSFANIARENISENENKSVKKKRLYFARNEQEAFEGFKKLSRKFFREFECLQSSNDRETQKQCLKNIIEQKKTTHKEYFEELRAYKNKAIRDRARLMKRFCYGPYSRIMLNKLKNLEKKYTEFFEQDILLS
jgi:hypothetical protein